MMDEEEEFTEESEEREEEEILVKGKTIYEAPQPQNTGPCYLLSVVYDGEKGRALVKLYDPESKKIYFWYDNSGHKPYFYTDISPDDLRKNVKVIGHKGFDHFERVELYDTLRDRKVMMTKIIAKDPLSVGGTKGSLREIITRNWEAKIRYHHCYIYDRQLIPGLVYRIVNGNLVSVNAMLSKEMEDELIKKVLSPNELEDFEYVDALIEWASILSYPIVDIKRVALDIEVLMETKNTLPDVEEARLPVIAVSVVSNDGLKVVHILRRNNVPNDDKKVEVNDADIKFYDNERDLLMDVFKVIADYPMVLTFNGDAFDLNYLWHRAIKLGIPKEKIPIMLTRDAAMVVPGVHVDLYKFFSNRAIKVYAFSNKYKDEDLDAISNALLGKGKVKIDKVVNELSYNELAAYCLHDAELTLELTTFNNNLVIVLMLLLARISRLPLEDVTRLGVSKWVQSLFYFEHRRRGYLIPNREEIISVKGGATTAAVIKGKKYMGAKVIEPVPGVHFNVIVLDFASLYPSILKVWNLSYETIRCSHDECKIKRPIPDTPHWVCTKKRGLTSILIGVIRDLRVNWYKPKSKDKSLPQEVRFQFNVVQSAMKVILNASYGVFGAEIFALYCPPMAESTTAIGREYIDSTMKRAEELGLKILYGDTDSLFIYNPNKSQLETLIKWAEDELKSDLDVDKVYRYVSFSNRKKNYFGILSDGTFEVKGLKGKKRDTPDFLKESFKNVVDILSKVNTPDDFEHAKEQLWKIVSEQYHMLKGRRIPLDKLAIRAQLGKDPEKYDKNTPQHVKAALMLKRHGVPVKKGMTITFVKVNRSDTNVMPVQLARIDEIDVDKYIDHMKTVYEQLLDALGIDFETLLGKGSLEGFIG
ncbi:MAG: DNA-directed DNA polymerase I [Thermoprotei archaeon]|jgi:DNA polymerase I